MDGNSKKSSVCRYFAASGDCYYGDECQYVHQQGPGERTLRSLTTGENHNLSQLPAESKLSTYLSSFYNHNNHDLTPQISALSLESVNSRRKAVGGAVPSLSLLGAPTPVVGNGLAANTQVVPSTNNQVPVQLPLPPPNYFISEEIKLELLRKQSLLLSQSSTEIPDLPEHVDNYHELCPLESPYSAISSTFGLVTSVYRATNMKSGEVVCLRRVHSFQPNTANTKSLISAIDNWKKLQHANIVQLRQVFTTKAFGDNSLVFVYDYFPGSQTLMNRCFATLGSSPAGAASVNGLCSTARPYSQQQSQRQKLLPESLIWTKIIQLSSALRTIHANGLACRAFDPTKIIVTSGLSTDNGSVANQHPRLRLSCCGVFDVVAHDAFLQDMQHCNPKVLIAHFQQEDLLAFGKVCLALACNSLSAVKRENWSQSLDLISRHYSADLRSLVFYLLSVKTSSPGGVKNINDIMPMIGARFYAQLDLAYQRYDILETEIAKELDNSRLFRMVAKLGSINERPELRMDPQWSDTGDRYLLKLFRDYLFHQVNEEGHPWLDIGHIVSTLNKLDVGSPEKICLVSRDDQNVLIVSFAELKRCFEAAFNELLI